MSSSLSSSHHREQGSTSTPTCIPSTTTTPTTKITKRKRPKHSKHQQKLIDAGVLHYGYRYPDDRIPPLPLDWEETKQRLARRRPSLSSSTFREDEYKEFVQANVEAHNEDDVKGFVIPTMLRAMRASNIVRNNVWFTNLRLIAKNIARAKPDYHYGARPEQLNQDIRKQLNKQTIPSTHDHLPAVPYFFLEVKGPNGSPAEVQRQALYNGTVGTRAIQSLQSYGQDEPIFDNKTYAISSTYQSSLLMIFAPSTAQPNGPKTRPEYYMNQIGSFAMTGSVDSFRQGATMYKNAIDLTREFRNTAIMNANRMAAQPNEDGNEYEDGNDEDWVVDEDEANEETE